MKSRFKILVFILLTVFGLLWLTISFLWAAKPPAGKEGPQTEEVVRPPDIGKKGEKFIIKGREYCYECIDNSECLGCHKKISERKFAQSVHGANSCNSCHWDITDVKEHLKAKGGRIHTEPVTCHRCHKREGREHYASAHFINDIQCKDCHKDIHEMTRWKGDKTRVIEKCTTCHSEDGYSESVHGKSVLAGNADSAACHDCHGLHKIPILKGEEPKVVQFRKEFHTEVCQKCHADKEMMERNRVFLIATQTYYESYHGKVEHLGYPKLVAGCADCHGFHSILPRDDPKSTISDARLVETCGKCHPGANTNFVMWIAHATHDDPERHPVFYWTFVIMTALLVSVFSMFWLHTILWWRRDFWEKRELRAQGIYFPIHRVKLEEAGLMYRRFSLFDIALHFTMMVTFIALVLTGLPLKFSHASWAKGLMALLGGAEMAGLIHRVAAAITFLYFGTALAYIVYFLFYKRLPGNPNPLQKLFGPESLCPRWKDIQDIVGMIRWFFNKGPKPQFDRWTYWEKFDFLAVFWGMFAIGLSGLMLWFQEFFCIFLPGWVINIAQIVHSDEALLASGFIFTVHFFNTHFRPSKFPFDPVIFTGRLPKYELVEERPKQYERLLAQKRLEVYREKYPSPWTDLFSNVMGFAMLAIGLFCIFLIGWEFLM
ncbi:MAG: cytochrome C [Syntrophaceae bacterium]|nr:cytochrome C [Syntrophaceae bacterium]